MLWCVSACTRAEMVPIVFGLLGLTASDSSFPARPDQVVAEACEAPSGGGLFRRRASHRVTCTVRWGVCVACEPALNTAEYARC